MQVLGSVLAKAIKSYMLSASEAERDSRLLVPGLTAKIADQIHKDLMDSDINCYLVVGSDRNPDRSSRIIRPVGLTSVRIGSFVAVAHPGQLAHIQDSIRGSGGAIRSITFSEEWPWIDNGSEDFKFDGPILDGLLEEWGLGTRESPAEHWKWVRELILDGLVLATRSSSRRSSILLDEILGSFTTDLYPEVKNIREKLLFHSGVPQPGGLLPDAHYLISTTAKLAKQVRYRCENEENIREQARDAIHAMEALDEKAQSRIESAVDALLDGIGSAHAAGEGALGFYGCWGSGKAAEGRWKTLDSKIITEVFDVREREQSELQYQVRCVRGKVEKDDSGRLHVATFHGENIQLEASWRIPDINQNEDWALSLYHGRKRIAELNIDAGTGQLSNPLVVNTADITSKYSKRLTLRIALERSGEVDADAKFSLHLCGEKRPAFSVVLPNFGVIDAIEGGDDEQQEAKIEVNRPVELILFSHECGEVFVYDDNDEELELKNEVSGIWKERYPIDATANPSGRVTRTCVFGERSVDICFESENVERGKFTVEDELGLQILRGGGTKLDQLLLLFGGLSSSPYYGLGDLTNSSRRRISLAKAMECDDGWRPVIGNLHNSSRDAPEAIGQFIRTLGDCDASSYVNLVLPENLQKAISTYSNARSKVIALVEKSVEIGATKTEHPLYATHPVFVERSAQEVEHAICQYLTAYRNLIELASTNAMGLDWPQLFILAHLDTAVHWVGGPLKNAFALVGPWHPLVVAKRFMVQGALYERGTRLKERGEGKAFRSLVGLLSSVSGFRWITGVAKESVKLDAMYVVPTSDPGWHLAFAQRCRAAAVEEGFDGVFGLSERIRRCWGIATSIDGDESGSLLASSIERYIRAFPSRRSLSINVGESYDPDQVVDGIASHIHSEDGPSMLGRMLSGGVRLYFKAPVDIQEPPASDHPPIFAYAADSTAILEQSKGKPSPDISMSTTGARPEIGQQPSELAVPRGEGMLAVLMQPLSWLTEGNDLIPKSVTYEVDISAEEKGDIGSGFIAASGAVIKSFREKPIVTRSVDLPLNLSAQWVVIPGGDIDPAVLVKYVRDGVSRSNQERALWDYSVDIGKAASSYYVLSTVPRGFQIAVNGFFNATDVASGFITELGHVGIAIGGEALKSGRHALGVLGLVGAVRLILGDGDGVSPLKRTTGGIGFLIPVDSFESFFSRVEKGAENGGSRKRTDLLAIKIDYEHQRSQRIVISCCGIESKFTSDTYRSSLAHDALEQARDTTREFRRLVEISTQKGGVPERLALLQLIRFGLRAGTQNDDADEHISAADEARIYGAILCGNYDFKEAAHEGILVSTEAGLRGPAECQILGGDLWVRLTKDHWPNVCETSHISRIRSKLNDLFAIAESQGTEDMTPSTGSGNGSTCESNVPSGINNAIVEVPENKELPIEERESRLSSNRGSIAGESVDSSTPLQAIMIGATDGRRPIYFDPQSRTAPLDNMNLMVTGSSGKGKTQFIKYLVCSLRAQNKPVILLDFKNDFASDRAFTDRANLEVVSAVFDGLPYNPLIPYPVQDQRSGNPAIFVGQHISGVGSVLKATYKLGVQQEAAVKNAIASAFEDLGLRTRGWIPYSEDTLYPDFSGVGEVLENQNPTAYNRLESLFALDIFRPEFASQSLHSLAGRSIVLDLSQLPSDDLKNALAQLLVMSFHSYLNTLPQTGLLRQTLVFDEAHRVLKSDHMLRLVRECRAYGVSIVLSSQYPSDFPADVAASMATKILQGNGRDIEKVKKIVQMLGNRPEESAVANLDRFEGFVDNRDYPATLARLMNYPVFIALSKLRELQEATEEELAGADGLDTRKLPIAYVVEQLERLGIAEEQDGLIRLI